MRKRCLIIPLSVILADRTAKILARRIPERGITLIPGILGLRYSENTGMAFSMMSGNGWLLGLISLTFVITAGVLVWRKRFGSPAETGLLLMLGGAAGNMTDRFLSGAVPDMIEPLFVNFAIFNIADVCLTVGCALVAIGLLSGKEPEDE